MLTMIIAALAMGSPAPPPAPDPAAAEAAPRYIYLFGQHHRQLQHDVGDIKADLDEFTTYPARASDPSLPRLTPEQARQILLDARPLIEGYTAAARLPAGDLLLDAFPDKHFNFDDPRARMVSSFHAAARLLAADAARAWAGGDRAALWHHAATITRMGAHLCVQNPSDALVPASSGLLVEYGMSLATQAIERGAIPDEAARIELRAAIDGVPAVDPSGLRRWWTREWRRDLDEARRTLDSPAPERAATRHFARLRNDLALGRQISLRLEELPVDMQLPLRIDFYERARGWIIWTYWPALYDAIDAGLIPALPRPFIENRFANAEALCLRAELAWTSDASPDRIAAIIRDADRDSTRLAAALLLATPRHRSEDLAIRARIDEFRARLDALPR